MNMIDYNMHHKSKPKILPATSTSNVKYEQQISNDFVKNLSHIF